jgi:methyl-accepting chemotaxis protein
MAAGANTLADLIGQAVEALRDDGQFILAAAVQQLALHNQELARSVQTLTEVAQQATALAEMFGAENGEPR